MLSRDLTIIYSDPSEDRARELTGANDASVMSWGNMRDERDSLRAQLSDLLATLAQLRQIAAREIEHINQGSCPDLVEGFHVRDDECPACRALIEADRHLPT